MVGNGAWNIKSGLARAAATACTLLLAGSLGGCALTTPSRAEVQRETVDPTVSAPSIREDGTLTVAMDTTDAPQAMNGSDGTATGYYADVARALAQRMGLKLTIVSSASVSKALGGKADIFIGASASDGSDDATVLGSVSEDASAVFVKTGDSQSASGVTAAGMAGGIVAVQESSASQDALVRAGIGAAQKTYSNVNECFEALASGEVQYVACDATAGAYLSRAYKGVTFAGIIGNVSSYGIAVSGGSDGELATAVSDALDAVSQDGTLDAVHAAWYGSLPLSLSGAVLSGVIIDSPENDAPAANEASGDASAENSTPITGDINSLGD